MCQFIPSQDGVLGKALRVAPILLALSTAISMPARSAELRGTVADLKGVPLHGASVFLDGTSKGVSTNASGEYSIVNIRPGNYLVVATMIGTSPAKREIHIVEKSATLELNFTLDRVPVDLGEVVVTANKERQNLQTVPIAVSAISADKIDDLTIRDRTDISALSPNSLVADTGSHMTDLINIRGIVPSTPFEATTLFYYDGVPIYGYGMNPMYLNDIERIEVIRGPQGTIYGRNALAGVVSIISQKPANSPHFNLDLEYGNYRTSKVSTGLSVPLTGQLFLRASVYDASRDGYYTNTYLNKNAGWTKGKGGTLNLRYFPSEGFSAELFGNMEQIRESIWPFASDPAAAEGDPYNFAMNVDSKIKKLNTIGSLKLGLRAAGLDLVSTTAYQDISNMDWLYDADFSPLDVISFITATPYRTFSQELRCESRVSSLPLKWMAGAFYADDSEDSDYSAILGEWWARPRQVPIWPIYQTTAGGRDSRSFAGFGQITYTLIDRLDVTSGARVERQRMHIDDNTRYYYNGAPAPPPFNTVSFRNQTEEFDMVSPRFAIAYRFDENNMLYGSASRAFHGGGWNALETIPYYSPEFTWNYEVGYKTTALGNTLRVNTDAFYIDWRDQQILTVGDLSSPFQTITNAGKTSTKGIELEVSALPFRGLSVGGAFGYLDATFDEFTFREVKDGSTVVYDYSGNDLQFTPKFSASMTAKYEFPARLAGRYLKGVLAADYQFADPYYMSHLNLYRSDARQLVGGRIGFSAENVDVFVWAKNLLDNRYVSIAYEYRGGQQAYLGPPRRVGLTVGYRY